MLKWNERYRDIIRNHGECPARNRNWWFGLGDHACDLTYDDGFGRWSPLVDQSTKLTPLTWVHFSQNRSILYLTFLTSLAKSSLSLGESGCSFSVWHDVVLTFTLSHGVGYATIKHLARHGAKIYMASRNESKVRLVIVWHNATI